MSFAIICSCVDGVCHSNCGYHCAQYWRAKTIHQAFTIKHAHQTTFENHDVEVREDGQIILNPEVKSEVK